jgi:hypothetical protein
VRVVQNRLDRTGEAAEDLKRSEGKGREGKKKEGIGSEDELMPL